MSDILQMSRGVVAIYVDIARDHARTIANRVAAALQARGYGVAPAPEQAAVLESVIAPSAFEDAALLVTIGGDGTLLRAARLAVKRGIPVLGINTGRLGFLTEFDEDDPRLARLSDFLAAGLQIEERAALEAEYAGRRYFALNDVVVRKGGVSRIVSFGLRFDREDPTHIPADGICVSTPTGSTAYFLSAGGSIIAPSVDAFGVVPLLPHTLFSRPLIVPTSSTIEISCDAQSAHAHLECDGDVMVELQPGAVVTARRYPAVVRFARTQPLGFFQRLEEKLRWGVSIKEKLR